MTKNSHKRKYACLNDRKLEKNMQRRKQNKSQGVHELDVENSKVDLLLCIASTPDVLPNVPDCKYCGARPIYGESPTFCCSSGEINLLSSEMPSDLIQLYIGNDDDAKEFNTCVRSYNNMFAFTSMGVHCDENLARRNAGIYTFRVQGQLYHFIDQLIPPDNKNPKNLQLYFFDTEHETSNRVSVNSKFKASLTGKLIQILTKNPYGKFFRSLNCIENLDDYKIALLADPATDQRVFNRPIVPQVAGIWLESNEDNQQISQHIQVYPKNNCPQIIKHYFGCYDPLQYPLIFPNEESASKKPKTQRSKVSCREYYCYKLQIRNNDMSFILHIGRLLQQYIVDMYIKIETSRLEFFRTSDMQNRLRNEAYNGVLDGIAQGCEIGSDIGKRVILPTSFIGGPRDMRKRYMDAIALVQRFGKPDIFLTITSNPNWPEIKALCLPSDEIHNRPDLISRIFHAKLRVLTDELFKKDIFGHVTAYTSVIEFQKRGLPHAHFLLILNQAAKMFHPEAFDRIVCAELPDPHSNPYLFSLVVKHMIHGPCGLLNPACPCMKKCCCKYSYPKEFSENTRYGTNSYPIYRRRDNKKVVTIRGASLDSRWVVPYSPYLLAKFNCHINVEICSTIQAIKYIYKYIYKGHDKILYSLHENEQEPIVDEAKNFQSARWISPPESA
ncbi:uncharacterized protein LOC142549981 [Primulina tabacum]|uniref:uncharacterized protein LOC142549981 n=1 Tax=Primulina tabacum TaxID=48773 RepID=UPI003F5A79F4